VSLPTLTDLKAEANIPNTGSDDELQTKLDQAIKVVEGLVGPIDDPVSVTETHYSVSSDVLVLKRMPVVALSAVSARSGSATTALPLADYELDVDTGLVRSVAGGWFRGTYTVTYTAGYDDLPADLAGAVVLIAAHLWGTQRGPAPTSPLANDDTFPTPGLGFAIPNRAQELLSSYIRHGVA
jgi:hypothetical protein